MSPLPAVLLVVGALLHCGLPSATAVRANYTELFSSFNLKQHIAYRIGQVECLKTLLSKATQYGLGALHRGDYNTDITRFSIRQRIAFYMDKYSASEYTSALRETRQDQMEIGQLHKKAITLSTKIIQFHKATTQKEV